MVSILTAIGNLTFCRWDSYKFELLNQEKNYPTDVVILRYLRYARWYFVMIISCWLWGCWFILMTSNIKIMTIIYRRPCRRPFRCGCVTMSCYCLFSPMLMLLWIWWRIKNVWTISVTISLVVMGYAWTIIFRSRIVGSIVVYWICCLVVGTTWTKHKGINTHTKVFTFGLYTFPNKHACPPKVIHFTWFRTYLIT